MNIQLYSRLLLLCIGSLLLTACPGTQWGDFQTAYIPVYMSHEELEESIQVEPPRPLVQTGKIYSYQEYLLINEKYRGVHIFDNSNPQSPTGIAFINIPGNVDIAIKDNVLYADNAVDLIALDLTNPQEAYVSKRVSGVFPVLPPPDNGFFDYDESKGVIIDWEL